MSLMNRFIDSLSAKERNYALSIISDLQSIFEKLEKRGDLRAKLERTIERTNFPKILRDSDNLFEAYNMLFDILGKGGRSMEFVEHNKNFGFNEKGLAYLFLSESIATFQRNAELFKNCFLFILKLRRGFRRKMTLGQFLRKLVDVAGTKGQRITQEIDVDLRNALAHGLFWMNRTELVYFKDVSLKKEKRIGLDELWMKTRDQSIVTQCFIKLIADWYVSGH